MQRRKIEPIPAGWAVDSDGKVSAANNLLVATLVN